MNKILVYLKMSIKTIVKYPSLSTIRSVATHAGDWYRLSAGEVSSVKTKIPWLCFSAINHIEKLINPAMKVFEYGSGGSTLFWASRAGEVISVEHDASWHHEMTDEFQKQGIENVKYILSPADTDTAFDNKSPENPKAYVSGDNNYSGKNFETYVRQIENYPDNYFDFIIVDGRARPSCILHSMNKLNLNGFLVVDNTERQYYSIALSLLNNKNWKKRKFNGPVPYSPSFSETSVFQKIHL